MGVKYTISEERRNLTTWTPLSKGAGGGFELDGVSYLVDAHGAASQALLTLDDGEVVAAAHGLGRTPWTVHAGGWEYTFVRSLERWSDQLLVDRGLQVGVIRKVADGRKRWVEAELPDMDRAVAVFVVAVVLTMWAGTDVTTASALN